MAAAAIFGAQPAFGNILTGEVVLGSKPVQFPNIPNIALARIVGKSGNGASVYVGASSSVTTTSSGTTTTCGMEVPIGRDTGWIPVTSLGVFWLNGASGDGVTYMVMF